MADSGLTKQFAHAASRNGYSRLRRNDRCYWRRVRCVETGAQLCRGARPIYWVVVHSVTTKVRATWDTSNRLRTRRIHCGWFSQERRREPKEYGGLQPKYSCWCTKYRRCPFRIFLFRRTCRFNNVREHSASRRQSRRLGKFSDVGQCAEGRLQHHRRLQWPTTDSARCRSGHFRSVHGHFEWCDSPARRYV
jgi:hypothetical protein